MASHASVGVGLLPAARLESSTYNDAVYVIIRLFSPNSKAFSYLTVYYFFILSKQENCLVGSSLQLSSAGTPILLPQPLLFSLGEQLGGHLHCQNCASLIWFGFQLTIWPFFALGLSGLLVRSVFLPQSVVGLLLIIIVVGFLRPSLRLSNNAGLIKLNPLGSFPAFTVLSAFLCSAAASLLRRCASFCFSSNLLIHCEAVSGSWSKRLLSREMAFSKQFRPRQESGGFEPPCARCGSERLPTPARRSLSDGACLPGKNFMNVKWSFSAFDSTCKHLSATFHIVRMVAT